MTKTMLTAGILPFILLSGCVAGSGLYGVPQNSMGADAGATASKEIREEMDSAIATDMPITGSLRADQIQNDKIVYNGDISLQVNSLADYSQRLEDILDRFGGFVESQSRGQEDNGRRQYDNCQIRIPADSYDDFVKDLEHLGTIEQESKNAVNISQSWNDTQMRIDSLEAEEKRLNELLSKAESVADIAAVEDQLRQVHDELQSLQMSKSQMDMDMAWSTIWISAMETSTSSGIGYAFSNTWSAFAAALGTLAVILVYLLPWLLCLAAAAAVVWFAVRRKKRLPEVPKDNPLKHPVSPQDIRQDGKEDAG